MSQYKSCMKDYGFRRVFNIRGVGLSSTCWISHWRRISSRKTRLWDVWEREQDPWAKSVEIIQQVCYRISWYYPYISIRFQYHRYPHISLDGTPRFSPFICSCFSITHWFGPSISSQENDDEDVDTPAPRSEVVEVPMASHGDGCKPEGAARVGPQKPQAFHFPHCQDWGHG